MKKSILLMSLILMSYLGFSQATPTETLRIADATTDMGKNLSTGKLVYNIADSLLYVTNQGVASAEDLTSHPSHFTLIGGVGDGIKTIQGDGNVLTTGQAISIDGAGIATTAVVGDVLTITATEVDGSVTNEFNTLQGDGDVKTTGLAISVDGAGITTTAVVGDVMTITSTEVDGSITNEGDLTVEAGGANDSEIHSNTSASSDVIISGGTGITVTESGQTITLATAGEANLTMVTEKFEEDDGTPTAHSLGHTTVVAYGCRVSLNGATLDPANYTLTTTTITIGVPVLQYDIVTITYNY